MTLFRLPRERFYVFDDWVEFAQTEPGHVYVYCFTYLVKEWIEINDRRAIFELFQMIREGKRSTPLEFLLVTGKVLEEIDVI